jgi:hypothetical protein
MSEPSEDTRPNIVCRGCGQNRHGHQYGGYRHPWRPIASEDYETLATERRKRRESLAPPAIPTWTAAPPARLAEDAIGAGQGLVPNAVGTFQAFALLESLLMGPAGHAIVGEAQTLHIAPGRVLWRFRESGALVLLMPAEALKVVPCPQGGKQCPG